jgi:hypothetical protein
MSSRSVPISWKIPQYLQLIVNTKQQSVRGSGVFGGYVAPDFS